MVLLRLSNSSRGFNSLKTNNISNTYFGKWLALNVSLILTIFLAVLLELIDISLITIIIAALSIAASVIARLLRFFYPYGAPEPTANDLIETLEALGAAGIGSLVVLRLLA